MARVIKRVRGNQRPSTEQAERVRFLVYARFCGGDERVQASLACNHDANALARSLRREPGVSAWVRRVAA